MLTTLFVAGSILETVLHRCSRTYTASSATATAVGLTVIGTTTPESGSMLVTECSIVGHPDHLVAGNPDRPFPNPKRVVQRAFQTRSSI